MVVLHSYVPFFEQCLLDLNDLRLFATVVDRGGFAAAARELNLPRSRISRRMALLEERLGVRLVQRTTRSFAVTEIGRSFHAHCAAMLVEAEAAAEVIAQRQAEPRGLVRIACPASIIYFQVGAMIARFMDRYPATEVHLESTGRRVDVIREGFDMAIRVRFPPLEDSGLLVRRLSTSHQRLVASPALLSRHAPVTGPEALAAMQSLGWGPSRGEEEWRLEGPEGAVETLRHRPRFVTEDMVALLLAALEGVGVCQFPEMVIRDDLAAGRLVDVLPGWAPRAGILHAVFPTRRGLLPSVRALLDFLAAEYAALDRQAGG